MNEKYFMIIQPNNFENPTMIKEIVLLDENSNIVYDERFSKKAKKYIVDLCNKNCIFITYNGFLLDDMLSQFFGISDYKNIINLMEDFAKIKGDFNEYFESYTWSKLQDALYWYDDKEVCTPRLTVNIYNAFSVINATYYLFNSMQLYEELQIEKEIEKGVI